MAIKSGTLYIDLKGVNISDEDTDFEIGDEMIFDNIARCKKHIVLQNFLFQSVEVMESQILSARLETDSLFAFSMLQLNEDDSVSSYTFYIIKRDGKTYIKFTNI